MAGPDIPGPDHFRFCSRLGPYLGLQLEFWHEVFCRWKLRSFVFFIVSPHFWEKSTPKGSKSRLNITIGHFACYSIGNRTFRSFVHVYVNISASSSNFDMRSIAYESWHPGASEVWSPIFAYSIGNRGKMGSKTKKRYREILFFKLFIFGST